jgi:hypothetical protein
VRHEDDIVARNVDFLEDGFAYGGDVSLAIWHDFGWRFVHGREGRREGLVAVSVEGLGHQLEVYGSVPGTMNDYKCWLFGRHCLRGGGAEEKMSRPVEN